MIAVPRVVLVGHDASRSGAPGLGLRWVRWATRTGSARTAVWLDRGGPLVEDFTAIAPTLVGGGPAHRARLRLGAGRPGSAAAHRVARPRHPFAEPPIVLANTLAAWATAAALRPRARLVLWAHELDLVADRILDHRERTRLLAVTDHIVAEGERVAAMLVDRWQVPARHVTVVDSFVDPPAPSAPATARHDLVAVGSLTPRKGPDAFVATLAALRVDRPDVRAAWVGGPLDGSTADLVRHDLARAGLTGAVDLVGEVDDVGPWLAPDRVLLHPAREDPDPVAVLDAAVRSMTVVTWDTGGAADLLRRAGLDDLVAPPGDVLGLARRTAALLDDRTRRHETGRSLARAAQVRLTDRQAPRLLAALLGSGA